MDIDEEVRVACPAGGPAEGPERSEWERSEWERRRRASYEFRATTRQNDAGTPLPAYPIDSTVCPMSDIDHEAAMEKFLSAVSALEGNFSETHAAAASHAARDVWAELYCSMVDVEEIRTEILTRFEQTLIRCDTSFTNMNVNQYPEGFRMVKRIRWYVELLGIFKTSGPQEVHAAIARAVAAL